MSSPAALTANHHEPGELAAPSKERAASLPPHAMSRSEAHAVHPPVVPARRKRAKDERAGATVTPWATRASSAPRSPRADIASHTKAGALARSAIASSQRAARKARY